VLAATDFFTVEVATWHGLATYYVLVVMELNTRRVEIVGITPHPTAAFMQQCARQLTDPFDGFLLGKRYLLHDRDTKFTQAFDGLLKASGVEPVVLPPRSPNLNAHCERFIRSIKEEALEHMVMLGESALSYAIHQYLIHYHTERNHQGLDNQLIARKGDVGCCTDPVVRRERLGVLLSYYYREAAWRDAIFQPNDVSCSAFASRQVLYERMFGGNIVRNAMTLFHTANTEPFRQRIRAFLRTAEESQ
jgi:transposase InsO family protein